jgi:tetratricopeptide (TPR) repeat protein
MFSPDGKLLYFSSNRPLPGKSRSGRYDIWYVEKSGSTWSEPIYLGGKLNTEARNLYSPVPTNSGNLYFSGNDKAFSQNHDIYCAPYENGGFAHAVKLGTQINTNLHESWFYVSPDESYILFFSGAQGKGSDLYISYREKKGSWTERKSLGDIVNSVGVRMPVISPDGKFLFFQGGEGCWWMDSGIIEYSRTHNLDFTSQLTDTVIKNGTPPALKQYQEFKDLHGPYFNLTERLINNKGYKLLRYKKTMEAISLFQLNAALFPDSSNVYDSLGEAYMITGKSDLAEKNYLKSLDLNPENENAKKMLSRLKKKKDKYQ